MKFKIDENMPAEVCELLREAGHDALSVLDQQLGGQPDSSIAAICQSEQRCIVTLDLDFSNIRAYPPQDYFGIMVLRLESQGKKHVLHLVPRILAALESENVQGHLWIIERDRIRIRGGG